MSTNDPVGTVEIAQRLCVQRATVDQWRQRETGFPEQDWTVGGRPAWAWGSIEEWARRTGRMPIRIDDRHELDIVNEHNFVLRFDGRDVAWMADGGNADHTKWAVTTRPDVDPHLIADAFGITPLHAAGNWIAHMDRIAPLKD